MPHENEAVSNFTTESEVTWTEEQKRVIELRDRSLLVSAAAGSGKTAVLVQRILSMVTDPEHPIDVDELLVVTYTNAAAAEMRERILSALTKAAEEHPDNRHLQRQLSLIHNAQITTVHSFCLSVVSNHFHRISLEPGFRIADEGELELLKEDVCDELLEEFYAAKDPEFLRFADGYSSAKSDKPIREMILDLYQFSQSFPWPDEWLDACAGQYEADSPEELEHKQWVRDYLSYLHLRAEEMEGRYRHIAALTQDEDGPKGYKDVIQDDLRQISVLTGCSGLQDWREALSAIEFMRLPSSAGKEASDDKKEEVKQVRKQAKDWVSHLIKQDFSMDVAEQLDILNKTGEMVRMLVTLTKAFADLLAREKSKKNILEFSDLEHFALQILVDPETKEPTETAGEYRAQFREVMVDEYQDSNFLQDAILTAVSGSFEGRQNMFMVGDVKQSIYRFRLARPELFMSKYDMFSVGESATQRIDLHKNFRSRVEILTIVNDIFGRIMGRDLGNIEYDEEASLFPGLETPDDDPQIFRPECILVERVEGEEKRITEAGVIARRIRTMIEQEMPEREYRDVVILLRSMKDWDQAFVTAFEREGVPLLVSSKTGYFSAQEVQVILSLLRIIDNPRQDIPLAAVMRSPIGGFSDEELALIKCVEDSDPFYACVAKLAHDEVSGTNEALQQKVERFWALVSAFRERVPYTPIHTLIQQIYDETGYRDLAAALPAGEQRRANLDMLLEKAAAYEKTSYHGLFHFVRYIDRLIKYNVDAGEAETVSEQENAVRLMTIHKSKGLEFPIVFVAGMGKNFNRMDSTARMILNPNYGIGLKWCDADRRVKTDTLIRGAFSVEAQRESLGEEQRILYVAFTRAKEKLIITGMMPGGSFRESAGEPSCQKLDFSVRMDAKTGWDWILPALLSCGGAYPLEIATPEAQAVDAVQRQVSNARERQALLDELREVDQDFLEELSKRFFWEYPYRTSGIKQKVSVSEIKHRAMEEAREVLEEDGGEELFPEEIPIPYIPRFVKEPDENGGALRGTAFHRFMECLDFSAVPSFSDPAEAGEWADQAAKQLVKAGRMESSEAELVDPVKIGRLLCTGLTGRMTTAADAGSLLKEQPFVMSVPAERVQDGAGQSEQVLIQGIIDAFWEEDDGIVLLDYKTDLVNEPEELIRRYKAQLLIYAEALGRRFAGKGVKEILIYSFCLDQVISISPKTE